MTSDRGAVDPQTFLNFRLYGKWLYPYRILHGASDLDQRCLKTCSSKDGCTFPPNIFALTPNSPFWGPFNAKTIMQIAFRQSRVNGATKVKLYSYIGIGKYLRVCQIFFPIGGVGPLV